MAIGAILSVLKSGWDAIKKPVVAPILHGAVNLITSLDDHGGVSVDQLFRVYGGLDGSALDGAVDEEEARHEQLLKNAVGAARREVMATILTQEMLYDRILNRSLINSRQRKVILQQSFEFGFALNEGTDPITGMPILGYGQHAFFDLSPRSFKNYKNLFRHEFFKFNNCQIKSQQISPDYTGTTLCFYPCSRNTRDMWNNQLITCCEQSEAIGNMPIEYQIKYTSPVLLHMYDISPSTYKTKAIEPYVWPNMPFRSEYISDLGPYDFLSYGHVAFVKTNMTTNLVSLRFIVIMEFDVWDQDTITDYEYETGGNFPYIDPVGDDSSNPRGCVYGITESKIEENNEEYEKVDKKLQTVSIGGRRARKAAEKKEN